MTLVRATRADAQWLSVAHKLAFPRGESWSAEVFATQLGLESVFGLIAPDQGFVLARVAADEAEILTLCVIPAARRRGAGRSLLAGAEQAAAARGAISMFLEVSTINEAAFQLYRTMGYEPAGLRKRYYPDGSDGVILRKDIGK